MLRAMQAALGRILRYGLALLYGLYGVVLVLIIGAAPLLGGHPSVQMAIGGLLSALLIWAVLSWLKHWRSALLANTIVLCLAVPLLLFMAIAPTKLAFVIFGMAILHILGFAAASKPWSDSFARRRPKTVESAWQPVPTEFGRRHGARRQWVHLFAIIMALIILIQIIGFAELSIETFAGLGLELLRRISIAMMLLSLMAVIFDHPRSYRLVCFGLILSGLSGNALAWAVLIWWATADGPNLHYAHRFDRMVA